MILIRSQERSGKMATREDYSWLLLPELHRQRKNCRHTLFAQAVNPAFPEVPDQVQMCRPTRSDILNRFRESCNIQLSPARRKGSYPPKQPWRTHHYSAIYSCSSYVSIILFCISGITETLRGQRQKQELKSPRVITNPFLAYMPLYTGISSYRLYLASYYL